ncbi:hypothetical protein Tco_0871973 [Tanacetum coccineum]
MFHIMRRIDSDNEKIPTRLKESKSLIRIVKHKGTAEPYPSGRGSERLWLEMEVFSEDVFDDEVQRNEAIPLSDEEIALDASSEGTLSPGGPRYDYMMNNEAEDE